MCLVEFAFGKKNKLYRFKFAEVWATKQMYPGRLDTSCVSREDVDIGAVLPHLGGLLTIPPPRDDVLAGFEVFRDDQLVGDHAKGPVPAAPALVPVVVWWMEFCWHVCCVSTVPALVYLRARCGEV